ncbi:MAG: twin-arginine translocase TatA/TatE family subunit [Candidatus Aminicenantes bacterium]|nr:twin-arginine translocase TatA/TatE family subunit [Candidatus Aminicenantes bacterium]
MIGSFGIPEMLVILVIVALLFGGKKLPQLGKGLGEGISNFKNSLLGKDKKESDNKESDNEKGN